MVKLLKYNLLLIVTCLLLMNCTHEKTSHEKWQELKTADFVSLLENAYDFIETPYFDSICGRLNDTVLINKFHVISVRDSINLKDRIIGTKCSLRNNLYIQTCSFVLFLP